MCDFKSDYDKSQIAFVIQRLWLIHNIKISTLTFVIRDYLRSNISVVNCRSQKIAVCSNSSTEQLYSAAIW